MSEPFEDRLRRDLSAVEGAPLPAGGAIEALAERKTRRRRTTRTLASTAVILATIGGVFVLVRRDDPARLTAVTDPTSTPETQPSAQPSTSSPFVTAPVTTLAPTTTISIPAVDGPWTAIPPNPRGATVGARTVWTGTEAVMVGGQTVDGAERDGVVAYDPATNSWRVLSTDPVPVADPFVVWTGTDILALGTDDNGDAVPAQFDLATGEWTQGTAAPMPITTSAETTAVWTGTELLLLVRPGVAAAYSPADDVWRAMPPPPLTAFESLASVWTGTDWILWGGTDGTAEFADGATYSVADDAWRSLPSAPISARRFHPNGAVWTGSEMMLTAGSTGGDHATGNFEMALSDGAAYDPGTDTWRDLGAGPAHPGFVPIWTGSSMVLFAKGGASWYDPITPRCPAGCAPGTWSDFNVSLIPHDDRSPVWTGQIVILLGSYDAATGGAIFTPPV